MCCGTLVAVGESKKQLKEPGTIFFKKIKKTEEKEKEKRKRKKPTKTNQSTLCPSLTNDHPPPGAKFTWRKPLRQEAGHSCLSQSRCHRGPRQRPAQSHRGAYDLVEEGYSLPENGLDLVDV